MTESTWVYLPLFLAAFTAGIMNAVAGGGTLLTFPTLIAALAMFGEEAAAMANATSTLALLPGSLAGAWGFRAELVTNRRFVIRMLGPSLVGGLIGSLLLAGYPEAFETLVPWLVLSAAILFLIQPPLVRMVRRWQGSHEAGPALLAGLMIFQFWVAVYGGYFGAGIGILMLTALGFMGVGDIHHMNGIKTVLAAAINAVTVVVVVAAGMVYWPYAGVMAVASVLGGYTGARVSRRLPPVVVRTVVVVIGFGLAAFFFIP